MSKYRIERFHFNEVCSQIFHDPVELILPEICERSQKSTKNRGENSLIMKEKRRKLQNVQELKSGHHELGERFDSKGHYAVHDALIQGARVVRALYN